MNRVRYRGESFVVERGGEAVCRIVPAGPPRCSLTDLVRALKAIPPPDREYLDSVEALVKNQPKLPKAPWER